MSGNFGRRTIRGWSGQMSARANTRVELPSSVTANITPTGGVFFTYDSSDGRMCSILVEVTIEEWDKPRDIKLTEARTP